MTKNLPAIVNQNQIATIGGLNKILEEWPITNLIDEYIEKTPSLSSARTIEEATSIYLQPQYPVLSEGVFGIQREVEIPLSEAQKEKIVSMYFAMPRDFSMERIKEIDKSSYNTKTKANIPFLSSLLLDSGEITYNNAVTFSVSEVQNHDNAQSNVGVYTGFNGRRFFNRWDWMENGERGKVKMKVDIEWEAPFKAHAQVIAPEIPEEVVLLRNKVAENYYSTINRLKRGELERLANNLPVSSVKQPSFYTAFQPAPNEIVCTGDLPDVEEYIIARDPALILRIPVSENEYRNHLVGGWFYKNDALYVIDSPNLFFKSKIK